jgi:hypothetical protein
MGVLLVGEGMFVLVVELGVADRAAAHFIEPPVITAVVAAPIPFVCHDPLPFFL